MGSMNGQREALIYRPESVEIEWLRTEERDEILDGLDHPWVMTEGPLDARLFRFERETTTQPTLLLRGTAFDAEATLVWDEEGLQLIRRAQPSDDVLAVEQTVMVRPRLQGPETLIRIDYLKDGAWLASRWLAEGTDRTEEATDA